MRPVVQIMSSSSSLLPLPFPTTISPTHHHRSILPASASPLHLSQQQPHPSQDTQPKPKTIRYRLSELCQQGQIDLARQLFDTIPQPTTVLWNTLIIGYVCNSMPQEAISFFSRMLWASKLQKCDPYTYSSVLKACAETKQLSIGKAVHCHILRSDAYPSRIVCNSLLNMYSTCLLTQVCEYDVVKRVFRTMRKRNVVSYNTMISWFTKRGRFVEAVEHFVMMMNMGFRPTAVSFVNVFPAISGLKAVEFANMVYGLVLKLGDEYVNDLFVVSSAITMYSELGRIEFARKIFDDCLDRNAHVWNAMMGGYVENNCPVDALELFCSALETDNGVNTDDVTLLFALTAASHLQNLDTAQQLHSYLIKISSACPVIQLNALIALYSRCNQIGNSFKTFTSMVERDTVSWNTMVSALIQNGLDDEGLMLVYGMQKQGFPVDEVTIAAILSAASNLKNQQIGKQAHAYLIRHGIQFNGMGSYLIDMYAKSGLMHAAETIFKTNCKSDTDQAIWNAMISGSVQNGLFEKAFVIFQQMLWENVKPNAVTLSSIIPASSQLGSIALGKLLHGFSIRNLLEGNVFVSSALVDMYSKSGAIAYAERAFVRTEEKNSVTYTNMILGYGQHGMGEKAIGLFCSMRECGINPDAITLVAVLSACSYTGLVDEGLEIFESMESKFGIRPSIEHCACVVDMLGRVGRVAEAYEFAQNLGKEGNVLGIWGSLLFACKMHQKFELGKAIADKLLDMEREHGITGYHVLLSNIHAEEGNWKDVKRLRKEMSERGLMKEVGGSWINISGYANFFASKDKSHPQCTEIYSSLEELCANMKDADYTPPFISKEL